MISQFLFPGKIGIRITAFAMLVLFSIWCCPAVGAGAQTTQPAESHEIIQLSEIEPGMRGVGKTVFHGARLEEFTVEVLGIVRSMTPQSGVILVRLTAPQLEQSGVIAGMSGSPVYVRKDPESPPQLMGAVAYGFPFAKDAIAGITPAADMLQIRELDAEAASHDEMQEARADWWKTHLAKRRSLLRALRKGEMTSQQVQREMLQTMLSPPNRFRTSRRLSTDDLPRRARPLFGESERAVMQPLPIPMAFNGRGAGTEGGMASLLRLGGYLPVQGAAGNAESPAGETEVAAGMPVGAVWMTGDLQLAGMGTATMVDDERVVAFGHPMSGTGRSNLPMALGRVEATIPSYRRSFRLASIERIIGRLTQDRQPGIVGRIGETAPMFPCTVHVSGERDTAFNYRIAGYWQVAPMASFFATAAGALRWEGRGNPETVLGISRIWLKDRKEPIVLKNLYAGFSPIEPARDLVLNPLSMLMFNPFEEVSLEKLRVHLQVTSGLRSARIESVRLSQATVRPGEKIALWVRLQEHQGQRHTRKLQIEVPNDVRPGSEAQIVICGASTYRMMQMSMDPGFFAPDDLESLIGVLERIPSSTQIYVRAGFVRRGLRYDGEAMPGLPGSMRHMLAFGTDSGRSVPLLEDATQTMDTHWVVNGSVGTKVQVKP